MVISFGMRVSVPTDVMVQEVAGESVLLNLKSERYFGLDDMGTCMWRSLTTAPSIQATYEQILNDYDVDAAQLRRDLNDLVENLVAHGLVEIDGVAAAN
jgi:Coenzyme PQQ synthesis protein D (PqqD)